jgi:hypothetical protein
MALNKMNDQQNMVVATVVVGLMLVVVYLCPWRIESTGELQWSPIYQAPMSYVRSYDNAYGAKGSSRIKSEEAHIAVGILALEVAILVVAGGVMYVFFSDPDADEEAPPEKF